MPCSCGAEVTGAGCARISPYARTDRQPPSTWTRRGRSLKVKLGRPPGQNTDRRAQEHPSRRNSPRTRKRPYRRYKRLELRCKQPERRRKRRRQRQLSAGRRSAPGAAAALPGARRLRPAPAFSMCGVRRHGMGQPRYRYRRGYALRRFFPIKATPAPVSKSKVRGPGVTRAVTKLPASWRTPWRQIQSGRFQWNPCRRRRPDTLLPMWMSRR